MKQNTWSDIYAIANNGANRKFALTCANPSLNNTKEKKPILVYPKCVSENIIQKKTGLYFFYICCK